MCTKCNDTCLQTFIDFAGYYSPNCGEVSMPCECKQGAIYRTIQG